MKTRAAHLLLVSVFTLWPQFAQAQLSGASASAAGSTADASDSDLSRRSSVATVVSNPAQFQSRFAWNISTDVTFGAWSTVSGAALHTVTFSAAAPGGYRLDISTRWSGDLNRLLDGPTGPFQEGSADLSEVTGSSDVELSSGTLSLSDPGAIAVGEESTETAFAESSSATILGVSNGIPRPHTLTFTWSGTAYSGSAEAAVRLGEGSSVDGCDACVYPGSPSRTQASDGHFVTVSLVSLCGNGVVDAEVAEDCDQGAANGTPESCCSSACTFGESGTSCRPSTGACDPAETCEGTSATCPSDAGSADADEDGVCDESDNCTDVANEDQSDLDGDALGDACDACTRETPAGQSRPKLTLSKLLAPAGDDKLVFKADFTGIPSSPSVDPVANGLRFLVSDASAFDIVDVTIQPGGYDPVNKTGWIVNRTATSWSWQTPEASEEGNGIRKAQLKALDEDTGSYRLTVKGVDGTYAFDIGNLPLTAMLVLDAPVATTGQCAAATFAPPGSASPSCAATSDGKTVRCK